MIDILIKLGAAAVAAVAAELIVKKTTGTGLVKRVTGNDPYAWWCRLRENRVKPWIARHPHLKVTRVVARLLQAVDTAAVAARRTVKTCLEAEVDGGKRMVIENDYEVPAEVVGVHRKGHEISVSLT